MNNILRIFQETKKAVEQGDSVQIKILSNQTNNTASLTGDPDNIAVAVIVYSLSKIIERENYKSLPGWKVFYNVYMKSIDGVIVALKNNDEAKARKYLEAIRFKPDFAITYRNLGRTYIKQNKLGEAIDKFLIALKLNPDDAVAHYNLAEVYSMKGLNEKAIEELEFALKLKPDYLLVRQALESIRKSESQSKKP